MKLPTLATKYRTLQFIISFLFLTLAMPAFADEPLRIEEGVATKISVQIAAGKSTSYTINGSTFKALKISIQGKEVQYALKRGTKLLSKGKAGSTIKLKSDGRSTYTLKLTNMSSKSSVTVSIVAEGGGSDI